MKLLSGMLSEGDAFLKFDTRWTVSRNLTHFRQVAPNIVPDSRVTFVTQEIRIEAGFILVSRSDNISQNINKRRKERRKRERGEEGYRY